MTPLRFFREDQIGLYSQYRALDSYASNRKQKYFNNSNCVNVTALTSRSYGISRGASDVMLMYLLNERNQLG
jgi:hypothetical protein